MERAELITILQKDGMYIYIHILLFVYLCKQYLFFLDFL